MHVNTRIMPVEFEYLEPKTKAEALEMLAKYDNVKVLAGGTDLIVKLKTGADIKVDYMMNVKEIEELNYIKLEDNLVKIGAVTPLSTIENNEIINKYLPILSEAIKAMAAIAVRNMGTIGGNLCNSSPAGDTIPPLTVYDAKLILAGKQGTKEVSVEEFITGPGKNVLAQDEMLVEVVVPAPKENTGAAFIKKTRVKADISKINTAVLMERVEDKCVNCRIAMGSVAAKVVRILPAEEAVRGQKVDLNLCQKAAQIVSDEIKPIDDNRSTAEYRKEIARVIVEDAMKIAWQRSGGEKIND
ncbi:MAG: FAD binding domain-containing protein [Bacillota bacterium]|jgi:CO/xanthine dehydrogenase FAD-binding subunit